MICWGKKKKNGEFIFMVHLYRLPCSVCFSLQYLKCIIRYHKRLSNIRNKKIPVRDKTPGRDVTEPCRSQDALQFYLLVSD